MSNLNRSGHYSIAWLDHEGDKVKRIIQTIGSMKRMRSTNEYLHDCCNFVSVIVKPLAPSEEMEKLVERAVAKINRSGERLPDIVLVDLSFGEHNLSAVDKGRSLALALRERFRHMAVGVYTAHQISNLERVMISADRFAAVLEFLPYLYEGNSRLDGDDWYNLFDRIIKESRREATATPIALKSSPENGIAKWAAGNPLHRSPSFMSIGPKLATIALNWIDPQPNEILLTQLAGGFSGSFVVKAEIPGRRQAYVIKMDENPQKLVQELAGHQRVRSLVGYNYYLPLLSPDMTRPETLTPDWWGAFAMAYEGEAKPLLDHPQLDSKNLASIYERLWVECLFDLYGSVTTAKDVSFKDLLTQEVKDAAKSGWDAISRYHSHLNMINQLQQSNIEAAIKLVSATDNAPPVTDDKLSMPWVERVHGDLNCRNVLYNKDKDLFHLIDFPHVGPGNYLATDFAKAEVELVLIILDWASGHDIDFSRLKSWSALTGSFSETFAPTFTSSTDSEIDRARAAIKSIRTTYMTRASGMGNPERTYLLYLLTRVLRYVGYSDLTVAKRFLALIWAGQLIKSSLIVGNRQHQRVGRRRALR
ncbi:MAG TPA: hypothetical protein VIW80_03975 [Pyrinomonadaceae bacterium]|jgi:hypothetical protein